MPEDQDLGCQRRSRPEQPDQHRPNKAAGFLHRTERLRDSASVVSPIEFTTGTVTAHPTAEWISHQLTEAYGWKVAPRYIIRDRDAVYGDVFIRRLRAMSIRDRPTAPRSPWQNGYCERAIGSIRRECLDHVVVFGERHLRHLLRSYATYYNAARTHLSVNKDAPSPRRVHAVGRILPTPFLGGLHHLYVRV